MYMFLINPAIEVVCPCFPPDQVLGNPSTALALSDCEQLAFPAVAQRYTDYPLGLRPLALKASSPSASLRK
jgi:hypothetical protein